MKQLKDSVRNVLARTVRSGSAVAVVAILGAGSVYAQSFGSDARLIGMGGLGAQKTDAVRMAGEDRSYAVIGLPIGLVQTLSNRDVFNPKEKSSFNIIKAVDYASNPNQFITNRDSSGAATALATDLIRADVRRDFDRYRGFVPQDIDNGGVFSPKWGKTFKVKEDGDNFHGVFFGIGPYVTLRTNVLFDPDLKNMLADSSVPVPASTVFWIGRDRTDPTTACIPGECASTFSVQSAAAITTGYRARFQLPSQLSKIVNGDTSDRDGIYVALSVSYLRGVRFEDSELSVLLETDSSALIDTFPANKPIQFDRLWSGHGAGKNIDFSTAIIMDRLSVNFGAEGIGNRMTWKDLKSRRYELASMTSNTAWTKTALTLNSTSKVVELPTRYSVGGSYRVDDKLSVGAQFRHGLSRTALNLGAEYPWWFFEFRGGMRYTDPKWNPTVGVGLKMGDKAAFDIAAYSNSGNIENVRKTAIAASFRVNR